MVPEGWIPCPAKYRNPLRVLLLKCLRSLLFGSFRREDRVVQVRRRNNADRTPELRLRSAWRISTSFGEELLKLIDHNPCDTFGRKKFLRWRYRGRRHHRDLSKMNRSKEVVLFMVNEDRIVGGNASV